MSYNQLFLPLTLAVLLSCGCCTTVRRDTNATKEIVCVAIEVPYPKGTFIAVIGRAYGHSYYVDGLHTENITRGDFIYNEENGGLLTENAISDLLDVVKKSGSPPKAFLFQGQARVRILRSTGYEDEYELPISMRSPLNEWAVDNIRDFYMTARRGTEWMK